MSKYGKKVTFQLTKLDIPFAEGKVIRIVLQAGLTDQELCFAFTHIGFLKFMEKNGLVPFPAGDLSNLINALKKDKDVLQGVERLWAPQKNDDNMEGMSILHVIDKEVAFEMICQTSLPFQLANSTAIIMYAPKNSKLI